MNLPPDCEFHEDIQLFVHRPHGSLDERILDRVVLTLGDLESVSKEPFNRFADTLGADAVELNFRYILHISLYRRLTYAGRAPVKSALLATNATIIQYAKLHKLMTDGSPIEFRIFEERQEAGEWLGVSLERLQ
jgi:hypothetical protein